MKGVYEQLSVDFNAWAQKLFIDTFEKFRLSVMKLDRRKDENVFQLQAHKYADDMKVNLENIANDLLSKNKSLRNSECNKILKENINFYVSEFIQKTKLL